MPLLPLLPGFSPLLALPTSSRYQHHYHPPPPPTTNILAFRLSLPPPLSELPPFSPDPRRRPISEALNCKCSSREQSSSAAEGGREEHEDGETLAAREAVRQLLRESGASEADSDQIASNSPRYVEFLVESVRELDQHSLWASWSASSEVAAEVGDFRSRAYLLAKRKGDGGMLPFLESVGLKLSSATLIARYLLSSSVTLPDLIAKVRFLKQMLYSSGTHEELIGRNARRMMKHLSISADDDIQRTLSFFEKLEAKHGGLNALGHGDSSFPYLIESFRQLLLCSTENNLKPLVDFLEQIGVPKESVRAIFLVFPPILSYDIEKDIKPRIFSLEKAGIEVKDIGRVLWKYPWILSTSIQENYEKILKFFVDMEVPKVSVDAAVRSWPHLLGCRTNMMESIVDEFAALGVNGKMLASVITSSPQLLLRRPNEFLQVVSFMKDIGLDDRTTGRILRRCPEIFGADVDNTLRKKVKFLTDFGILKGHLPRVIRKYPELLLLDVHCTLLPRMRYLMRIGLSKSHVCSMVSRFSPILGYSIDDVLRPKLVFLMRTMRKPLSEVVEYPRYFSYSLEKKILPRYLVLKRRNIECSLREMLAMNDEKFAEQYELVVPFLFPAIGDG